MFCSVRTYKVLTPCYQPGIGTFSSVEESLLKGGADVLRDVETLSSTSHSDQKIWGRLRLIQEIDRGFIRVVSRLTMDFWPLTDY